eukprot:gene23714-29962_t
MARMQMVRDSQKERTDAKEYKTVAVKGFKDKKLPSSTAEAEEKKDKDFIVDDIEKKKKKTNKVDSPEKTDKESSESSDEEDGADDEGDDEEEGDEEEEEEEEEEVTTKKKKKPVADETQKQVGGGIEKQVADETQKQVGGGIEKQVADETQKQDGGVGGVSEKQVADEISEESFTSFVAETFEEEINGTPDKSQSKWERKRAIAAAERESISPISPISPVLTQDPITSLPSPSFTPSPAAASLKDTLDDVSLSTDGNHPILTDKQNHAMEARSILEAVEVIKLDSDKKYFEAYQDENRNFNPDLRSVFDSKSVFFDDRLLRLIYEDPPRMEWYLSGAYQSVKKAALTAGKGPLQVQLAILRASRLQVQQAAPLSAIPAPPSAIPAPPSVDSAPPSVDSAPPSVVVLRKRSFSATQSGAPPLLDQLDKQDLAKKQAERQAQQQQVERQAQQQEERQRLQAARRLMAFKDSSNPRSPTAVRTADTAAVGTADTAAVGTADTAAVGTADTARFYGSCRHLSGNVCDAWNYGCIDGENSVAGLPEDMEAMSRRRGFLVGYFQVSDEFMTEYDNGYWYGSGKKEEDWDSIDAIYSESFFDGQREGLQCWDQECDEWFTQDCLLHPVLPVHPVQRVDQVDNRLLLPVLPVHPVQRVDQEDNREQALTTVTLVSDDDDEVDEVEGGLAQQVIRGGQRKQAVGRKQAVRGGQRKQAVRGGQRQRAARGGGHTQYRISDGSEDDIDDNNSSADNATVDTQRGHVGAMFNLLGVHNTKKVTTTSTKTTTYRATVNVTRHGVPSVARKKSVSEQEEFEEFEEFEEIEEIESWYEECF